MAEGQGERLSQLTEALSKSQNKEKQATAMVSRLTTVSVESDGLQLLVWVRVVSPQAYVMQQCPFSPQFSFAH